jgi:parvulin-like peptidyl-prolyl isomerase
MSDFRVLHWCFTAAFVSLALGCGDDGETLARVGSRKLELAPFQEYVAEVTGEAWQGVNARVTSRLLDQFLDRQLVLETARRRDLQPATASSVLGPSDMQKLLDELCGPPPQPANTEISDEVTHRLEVVRPAQAHVRQVLVDSHEQALAARQRLAAGEDFVEISREVSRAPNAAEGGELGFFDQGSLTPEIDEVIFSLEAGSFSDPVQGPSGFHIFQVLEVVPEGPPNRNEVIKEVRAEFAQRVAREHTRECISGLVSETGVEVHEKLLWFPYSGRYAEDRNNA